MELLTITVSAPVVSFRRPLDLNYQRTLPLPPPTTLLGLAGAALGISDVQMWHADSPLQELRVSVLAQPSLHTHGPPGKARDMWTVLKIKNNRIQERSPYFRELLFFARFTLLYGGPRSLLDRLKRAFLDPAYPLSLGREDEMIWVESSPEILPLVPAEVPRFRGTAVPGDIRNLDVRVLLKEGVRIEPPTVEIVPRAFQVDRKGIRAPVQGIPLTFLPLSLEVEIRGIQPVYTYRGRCFTWLNL